MAMALAASNAENSSLSPLGLGHGLSLRVYCLLRFLLTVVGHGLFEPFWHGITWIGLMRK
jgi:hypothetical protein